MSLKQGCYFKYLGTIESLQTKPTADGTKQYTMIKMRVNGKTKTIMDFDNTICNYDVQIGSYSRISGELELTYDSVKKSNNCIFKVQDYKALTSKEELELIAKLSVKDLVKAAVNRSKRQREPSPTPSQ
ncbi:hypothetical protein MIR68_000200 [Amoeboaphelidium protococcarum]|nr:hypothetical protein MIR68_012651 [Amoeboaphelidium protococcarum]KAI3641765.1 hypothetical protein MIR68_000200 [Amoeboaphelidium protococcarum]KAI3646863.1 hypothetical protein MP228_007084 [Amoeboaphelidium protococcarum]